MKYIKTLVAALVATALFTTAAVAATNAPAVTVPAADKGDWTLTLAGSGATTLSGVSQSDVGLELGVGHTGKVLLPVELGVRQTIAYNSKPASLGFNSKIYADFTLIKVWNVELQAGANAGVAYGDTAFTYSVAPEAVAKLYLKKDIWAFGRVEYPYDISAGTSKNTLVYTIGLGLSF
jgi:opacity protein-like surface antigen